MGLNFSLINFNIIKTGFLGLRKVARYLLYHKNQNDVSEVSKQDAAFVRTLGFL